MRCVSWEVVNPRTGSSHMEDALLLGLTQAFFSYVVLCLFRIWHMSAIALFVQKGMYHLPADTPFCILFVCSSHT